MNWFKKTADNNSITILYYIDGNSIGVKSGTGIEYIYYGIPRGFDQVLRKEIKKKGYGYGWQLLKKYENGNYQPRMSGRKG